ncbi:MAG: YggT family protein [Gammaproteobacteria bacterium]|nr:YggT family protein [Gammaproteobacteria bacterium]MCW8988621.1 YggT family protein [Gammaproteobacteria bacterium]MCW9031350.1 YggT family protein [Gammaproteobacteria bacterium]
MNPFSNAGVFLVSTIFGLYILAIMLRLILQMVRADFYNPVSRFLVKITNPVLKHLRRFVPGFAGIDMASVIVMLALQMLEIFIITVLRNFPTPDILGLTLYAFVELITLGFYVFLISIFIMALLSWINPGQYNPVNTLLHQITEPVLRPARRLLPPMSGMDLSPMLAMVGLWLVKLLFLDPLGHWAQGMMYPTARVLMN